MRQQDRSAPHRDRDGLAPRSRRVRGAARHGRPAARWTRPRTSTRRSSIPGTQPSTTKFQFPRIVKKDWPNIYKISTPWPTSCTSRSDGTSADPRSTPWSRRTRRPPRPPRPRTRRCSATRTSTITTHKGGQDRKGSGNMPGTTKKTSKEKEKESEDAKLAPKDFTDSQKGMITAFNRYICYIHPAPADTAGQDQLARGAVRACSHLLRGAALGGGGAAAFRDIAMNHPDKDVGIYAAQLYLESVNVLGSHTHPARIHVLQRHGGGRPEVHRALLHGARAREEPGPVHDADEDPVRHPASQGPGADQEGRREAGSGAGRVHRDR